MPDANTNVHAPECTCCCVATVYIPLKWMYAVNSGNEQHKLYDIPNQTHT